MDKLAIIGSGYMAKIIAVRAKELGVESHCFSNDSNSIAAAFADYFHNINILEVDKLAKICKDIGVNGVVATTELTIWPAAYVSKCLGLNGNDEDVAKKITDKTYVRSKIEVSKSISQPCFWIAKDINVLIDKYPVIVKPIAAGGKRGITVLANDNNKNYAIEEAINNSKVKGALIEQFLAGGKEYSVESLSYHGKHYVIQITEKETSGPPHCVELGHHQPANLTELLWKKVVQKVSNSLSSVGIKEGPCHTEIKIIDKEIYLIEINARPGGDHIAYPLTELSTGYPYITGVIEIALNKFDETRIGNFEKNYCGVQFVSTQTEYLKPIFDRCENEPWCYKKNYVSDELKPIIHNDGFNTNYFIYFSKKGIPNFGLRGNEK